MKVFMYDTHSFEKDFFCKANEAFSFEMSFTEARLDEKTAALGKGHQCICAFVNDHLSENVLKVLKNGGVELIALRSAGHNHVDLKAADSLGLKVVRVPEYSPYAVAEHAVALLLTLNRKIHKAYNRVREGNFSLEGLVGFDLHGKTVGVIGTGKIGKVFVRIMRGFGCEVLAYDISPDEKFSQELQFNYTDLKTLFQRSDIISIHLPLTPESKHLINKETLLEMKKGIYLINTSRGAIIDTRSLIDALKSGMLGGAGLDVYEEEENFFFQDLSSYVLSDDMLARLMTFPNVILTGHQAFLTKEALHNIAETTLKNIAEYENGASLTNEVLFQKTW